jgi:hypothetical protein
MFRYSVKLQRNSDLSTIPIIGNYAYMSSCMHCSGRIKINLSDRFLSLDSSACLEGNINVDRLMKVDNKKVELSAQSNRLLAV